MPPVSRGFRRREPETPPAADRVPPGQHVVDDFPVLTIGPTPHTPPDEWTFEIVGEIDDEYDAPPTLLTRVEASGSTVVPGSLHPDEVMDATGFEMPDGE